jgi:hypothetical protein
VIYNPDTDIDDLVTPSITSVLLRAGELLDEDLKSRHFVSLYDMTEEDYSESFVTSSDASETYTLKGFIKHFGIEEVPDAGLDTFHNLDQNEQLEVLKFIPDQMIIDELRRRFEEYRRYADAIRDAGDQMRIYV